MRIVTYPAFRAAACDKRHPSSCHRLGEMRHNGRGGDRDLEGAAKAYEKGGQYEPPGRTEKRGDWKLTKIGASVKVPKSCYRFAQMYEAGEGGLERDRQRARQLYASACRDEFREPFDDAKRLKKAQ